jgi:hypothetical protein
MSPHDTQRLNSFEYIKKLTPYNDESGCALGGLFHLVLSRDEYELYQQTKWLEVEI